MIARGSQMKTDKLTSTPMAVKPWKGGRQREEEGRRVDEGREGRICPGCGLTAAQQNRA